jgi:hypothetical protein
LLVLGALCALPFLVASAALPETNALLKGTDYIRSIQKPDGMFGTADPGQNMDAILAFRAAGYDPAKEISNGKGPVDFLKTNTTLVSPAAVAAKAALTAKAAGLDPRNVGGVDYISKVTGAYDPAKGTYAKDDFSQSVAMLGLACTGNSLPAAAATALKTTQLGDGGWGFGGTSDPDTSAIAVQALLAGGVPKTDAAVTKGLAFFKATQAADGGWGFDPSASNASSTAYVVQALIALGENPESAAYTKGSNTPVSFLLSQQSADGSFLGFDPAFSTNQVVPALAGRTICNTADTPITRTRPAPAPTATATTPAATVPPATATVAPKPPTTGNSNAGGDGSPSTAPLLVPAVTLICLGLAATAAQRAKKRR